MNSGSTWALRPVMVKLGLAAFLLISFAAGFGIINRAERTVPSAAIGESAPGPSSDVASVAGAAVPASDSIASAVVPARASGDLAALDAEQAAAPAPRRELVRHKPRVRRAGAQRAAETPAAVQASEAFAEAFAAPAPIVLPAQLESSSRADDGDHGSRAPSAIARVVIAQVAADPPSPSYAVTAPVSGRDPVSPTAETVTPASGDAVNVLDEQELAAVSPDPYGGVTAVALADPIG